MKNVLLVGLLLFLLVTWFARDVEHSESKVLSAKTQQNHWFLLYRKSNIEFLYFGVPGEKEKSTLKKIFIVKTGIPGQRPTPLPQLLGKEYWIITDKQDHQGNFETGPYFLTLDVPADEYEPYGPNPYLECNGQCNWIVRGDFGLHGTGGDSTKLSQENAGSSGCIRHSDEDIAYLYSFLDPQREEIRYYIEDI